MNQTTGSLKFALVYLRGVTAGCIPQHVMRSDACGRHARRSQNPLRIPMRRLNRMCKKQLQVLNQTRQRCPLRATNKATSLNLRMVLKTEPTSRVRPHEVQDAVKSGTKACPLAANVMILFPSLSGIAFFARVSQSPKDQSSSSSLNIPSFTHKR